MGERARAFILVSIMTAVSLVVVAVAVERLYSTALSQQHERLTETAASLARFAEAIGRHEAAEHPAEPDSILTATLAHIAAAQGRFPAFGRTGEILLGRRDGNQDVLLLHRSLGCREGSQPVPLGGDLDESMRLALSGRSGMAIGLDERGRRVLAAYEPVHGFNLGVIAKIDLAEIRTPFVRAAAISLGVAVLAILLGAVLFIRLTRPIIDTLRESQEKYRQVVENAGEAIVVAQAGMLRFVNPKVAEMTGRSREDLLNRPFLEFIHPDDREMVTEYHVRRLRGDLVPETYEVRVVDRNGDVRWVENNGVRIQWEGSPASLNFLNDVTARKRAEEERGMLQIQLLQAQKMEAIGTLAGGVAHDFNNLLTTINGYSELLMGSLGADHPARLDLLEIKKSGERAAALTRQLLAFGRRQEVRPEVLDINGVVAEMDKMLRRLIGEDIRVTTRLDPHLRAVRADAGNIEQVVMNLATNARDAMPGGGELRIETANVAYGEADCRNMAGARPGDFVCLSVSDTGTGMEREVVDRVFEPFFSTKEAGRGTGLGLSVVYGIARQHGGWVAVDSRPGEGSVFRVFLPVCDECRERLEEKSAVVAPLRGRRDRVLLIEDEDSVRSFSLRVLGENGFRVEAAGSVEEAKKIFREAAGGFDVVFCDVVLPDGSGVGLASDLQKWKPDLRVLMSSGYSDATSQCGTIEERQFSFIQKPYSVPELLRAVEEAAGRLAAAGDFGETRGERRGPERSGRTGVELDEDARQA